MLPSGPPKKNRPKEGDDRACVALGSMEWCESRSNSSFDYITEINANDVLLGRGAPIINNVGNVAFREIIRHRKREYLSTARHLAKDRIAREVVQEVHNRNGRFLRRIEEPAEIARLQIPPGAKAWAVADEAAAIEKSKQALRDKDPPLKIQTARESNSQKRRLLRQERKRPPHQEAKVTKSTKAIQNEPQITTDLRSNTAVNTLSSNSSNAFIPVIHRQQELNRQRLMSDAMQSQDARHLDQHRQQPSQKPQARQEHEPAILPSSNKLESNTSNNTNSFAASLESLSNQSSLALEMRRREAMFAAFGASQHQLLGNINSTEWLGLQFQQQQVLQQQLHFQHQLGLGQTALLQPFIFPNRSLPSISPHLYSSSIVNLSNPNINLAGLNNLTLASMQPQPPYDPAAVRNANLLIALQSTAPIAAVETFFNTENNKDEERFSVRSSSSKNIIIQPASIPECADDDCHDRCTNTSVTAAGKGNKMQIDIKIGDHQLDDSDSEVERRKSPASKRRKSNDA